MSGVPGPVEAGGHEVAVEAAGLAREDVEALPQLGVLADLTHRDTPGCSQPTHKH